MFTLLGILGLGFFIRFYDESSPTAAIDLEITATQAQQIAEDFASSQGISLENKESAVIFSQSGSDREASVYLQQTVGIKEANRMFREELTAWYWAVRWFRPLDREELEVRVSPNGRLVGFAHAIPEEEPRPSLGMEAALNLAREFASERYPGDFSDLNLVSPSATQRPARVDYEFIWERQDFKPEEASFRIQCTVAGDQIIRYSETLKPPDEWLRGRVEKEHTRIFLGQVARMAYVALWVAAVVVMLARFREGSLPGGTPVRIGLILMGVTVLKQLNFWPLFRFYYDTNLSEGSFVLNVFLSTFSDALTVGTTVALIGIVGLALAQELWPARYPRSGDLFVARSRKDLSKVIWIGYCLAALHLAYVTGFYLVGQKHLGVFSPIHSPFNNILSTEAPWLFPLTLGLQATFTEEFFFRLFAISLLRKWFRNDAIAIVIPAVIWGFMHSSYDVSPEYCRGIELTVVGIILGWAFIRFGLVVVLVEHYVYDAMLGSQTLLQSDNWTIRASGLLVMGLMFLPLLLTTYRRLVPATTEIQVGERAEEEFVSELGTPAHTPEPPSEEAPVRFEILSKKKVIWALVIAVLGMALAVGTPSLLVHESKKFTRSRAEILTRARNYAQFHGIPTEETIVGISVRPNYDHNAVRYLVQTTGVDGAKEFVGKSEIPAFLWDVGFARPQEVERIRVALNPDGDVSMFDHTLPDDAPGEELDINAAREIALRAVNELYGVGPAELDLIQEKPFQRRARRDFIFEWRRLGMDGQGLELRYHVAVQGNRLGRVLRVFHVPEVAARRMAETLTKEQVLSIAGFLAVGFLMVYAGTLFFIHLREKKLPFRGAGVAAGAVGALLLLQLANGWSDIRYLYSLHPQGSETLFTTNLLIAHLEEIGAACILAALAVVIGAAAVPRALPALGKPKDWWKTLRNGKENLLLWYQGGVLSLALIGVYWGMSNAGKWILHKLPFTGSTPPEPVMPAGITHFVPLVDAFGDNLLNLVGVLVVAVVGFSLITRLFKSRAAPWIAAAVGVAGWAMFGIRAIDTIMARTVLFEAGLGIAAIVLICFVRFNWTAYLLAVWCVLFREGWILLTAGGTTFLYVNGALLILIGSLPYLWIARRLLKNNLFVPWTDKVAQASRLQEPVLSPPR